MDRREVDKILEVAMKMYTPENITELMPDEVFVFGSNPQGRHGSGAAKDAIDKFGAIYGQGIGLQGQCYAIPTKDMQKLEPLSLKEIDWHVENFLYFALRNRQITFLVTKIGCGLAGLSVDVIAPMFIGHPENVILPYEFVESIKMYELQEVLDACYPS